MIFLHDLIDRLKKRERERDEDELNIIITCRLAGRHIERERVTHRYMRACITAV